MPLQQLSPRAQKAVRNAQCRDTSYRLEREMNDHAQETMNQNVQRVYEEATGKQHPGDRPANQPGFAFCTEAPASVNIRAVSPEGFPIQLTLRGIEGLDVMIRMQGAIVYLAKKGYTPSGNGNGHHGNGANGTNGSAPLCPTHGRPMKESKHGGWFCPVKVADDDGTGKAVYCKQKTAP